jgi:hypothetical protein
VPKNVINVCGSQFDHFRVSCNCGLIVEYLKFITLHFRATGTLYVSFLEGVCSLIYWNEIEEKLNEKNASFNILLIMTVKSILNSCCFWLFIMLFAIG